MKIKGKTYKFYNKVNHKYIKFHHHQKGNRNNNKKFIKQNHEYYNPKINQQ